MSQSDTPDVATEVERWIAAVAGDSSLAGAAAHECRSMIERRLRESQEKLATVEGERDELRQLSKGHLCVWCGQSEELGGKSMDEALNIAMEHDASCKKHPLYLRATAAEARCAELREALRQIAEHFDMDGYGAGAWKQLALEMAEVARAALAKEAK